jgi:hypothetical protein
LRCPNLPQCRISATPTLPGYRAAAPPKAKPLAAGVRRLRKGAPNARTASRASVSVGHGRRIGHLFYHTNRNARNSPFLPRSAHTHPSTRLRAEIASVRWNLMASVNRKCESKKSACRKLRWQSEWLIVSSGAIVV